MATEIDGKKISEVAEMPSLEGNEYFPVAKSGSQGRVSTEKLKGFVLSDKRITDLEDKVFPLSLSVSGGGVFEKGTPRDITVGWTMKKGDTAVTPDKVTVNGNAASGGSMKFTGVSATTAYTVKAEYQGKSVQGSTTATFVGASRFGAVAAAFTPTADGVKALAKNVKNTKAYTGTADLSNQKLCYAYPKSFGALSSIKDANNFDYIGSYTRSELDVDGETYYVYVLTDPSTITGFKQIYS